MKRRGFLGLFCGSAVVSTAAKSVKSVESVSENASLTINAGDKVFVNRTVVNISPEDQARLMRRLLKNERRLFGIRAFDGEE